MALIDKGLENGLFVLALGKRAFDFEQGMIADQAIRACT